MENKVIKKTKIHHIVKNLTPITKEHLTKRRPHNHIVARLEKKANIKSDLQARKNNLQIYVARKH